MYTCLREQNFPLRHGYATFPLTSTKNQFFSILQSYYNYNFSGSKRPWLMNKFCLLRFSISYPMVFDALTARKIISKQHMKYVSVIFFKLTKL